MQLLDFGSPEVASTFRVINDGVMGGMSTSRLRPAPGFMAFEGEISLAANGGFASFRGPIRIPAGSSTLLLTVRGDGQRYKLALGLDDAAGAVRYQAAFIASREWQTIRFRPGDFRASLRGRAVAAQPLEFERVQSVGLLIADGQSGPFMIELKEVCGDAAERAPGA